MRYIERGWPEKEPVPTQLKSYFRRKAELAIESGLIMWGPRVVVPLEMQKGILTILHKGHPCISRMKGLARSYYWWPSLDVDIEAIVREYSGCQAVRNHSSCTYDAWPEAKTSWQRLHVDFAGRFLGKCF